MAKRGSKKALSVEHEEYVAKQYHGTRSRSSGAADHDQGDVRGWDDLIECKGRFGERVAGTTVRVRSTLVTQMEKIADEAWAESKNPVLALRFYMPDSPLADGKGYVDLVVRPLHDDVARGD